MNIGRTFSRAVSKVTGLVKAALEERECQRLSETYDINGYRRIYLVHIRKTGGTSLNNMFLSMAGEDSRELYGRLVKASDHRLICNGLIYVGWNVRLLNRGSYFYGFSHTPLHQLSLPSGTFTVSCFRDPVKRVVSHYNMLMEMRLSGQSHPCLEIEGRWLGSCFEDFIGNIPENHLKNQLYMYSPSFDISEAVDRVSGLSWYFFSDQFSEGVAELNRRTGLDLESIHIRKAGYREDIKESSLEHLREMLEDEYRFLAQIRY